MQLSGLKKTKERNEVFFKKRRCLYMYEELSINNIDNYVNGKYSICREERQYALYLSNVLRYYGNPAKRLGNDKGVEKIFEACGFKEDLENIVIENVYYEVTFMRDFFERNRRINLSDPERTKKVCLQKSFTPSSYFIKNKDSSFNRNLLSFCWEKFKKPKTKEIDFKNAAVIEVNFGQNEIPDSRFKAIRNLIRAMMNSKPDLAVIYHVNNARHLLFIECKFDSSEDKITGDIVNDNYSQTKIQGYIAEFLCRYYFTNISISEMWSEEENLYKSKLVRFSRKDNNNGIDISRLIDFEKKVFERT